MWQQILFVVLLSSTRQAMASLTEDRCALGIHCSTKPEFACGVKKVKNIDGCDKWRKVSHSHKRPTNITKKLHSSLYARDSNIRNMTVSWEVFQDAGHRFSVVCFARETLSEIGPDEKTCYAIHAKAKLKGNVKYSLNCIDFGKRPVMPHVWIDIKREDICLQGIREQRGKRKTTRGRSKCVIGEPKFKPVDPKILNVSMRLSNNEYRYCTVFLMDRDIHTYLASTDIEPKTIQTTAVFGGIEDDQYRVLIECQKGKARERRCRSLSSLHTLIFSKPNFTEFTRGPEVRGKTNKQDFTEQFTASFNVLVFFVSLVGAVVLGVFVVTLVVCLKRAIRHDIAKRRRTRNDCSIPLCTIDNPDPNVSNGNIRIWVITAGSDQTNTSLCSFLDSHPGFSTTSLEKDYQNARADVQEWVDNSLKNTDVVLMMLTEALAEMCVKYVEEKSAGLRFMPCMMVDTLQKYLSSSNIRRDRPVVLTVQMTDISDQNVLFQQFRQYFYRLNSGMIYTITKERPGSKEVQFHDQTKLLLDTIQRVSHRKPVHIPPGFLTSPEANSFLKSVKEMMHRKGPT